MGARPPIGLRSPLVSQLQSQRGWRHKARARWARRLAKARNPAARSFIQLALILGLAFIESLVLFTLVIIFVKVA
jgi:hypothetical protein